ncbi:MAG: hypothetical protein WA154_10960 [Moraxellaceae bacterium]
MTDTTMTKPTMELVHALCDQCTRDALADSEAGEADALLSEIRQRLEAMERDAEIKKWSPLYETEKALRKDFKEQRDSLRDECKRLQEALGQAADDILDWACYADTYFHKKHDLTGTVAKYRALSASGREGE